MWKTHISHMRQKGRGLTLIIIQYLSCPKYCIRHIASASSVLSYQGHGKKTGYSQCIEEA